MTTFVLGGGCFWCLDAVYRDIKGVVNVTTGYAGGDSEPTYYQVASGSTKHAEVVEVRFDETIIPADIILDIYFLVHDPTTLNQQGADIGPQYRSVMFYKDANQQEVFKGAAIRAAKIWSAPIITEVQQLTVFYPASQEHQNFFNNNPESGYCSIVIIPKILKARSAYKEWIRED